MTNLKKICLIVAMVMAFAGTASASIINFGVKAGMNFNKIHFNQDAFNELEPNSTGWEAGVMAEFNIPVIGLCFDASLMYARMNNAQPNIEAIGTNGNPHTLVDGGKVYGKNFLEVPINIKYKFQIPVVASIIKPYIFTGPDFAFKLDKDVFDALETRTCQVAWNVGLGVELINHLQIGASYGFGINNILDDNDYFKVADIKANNNYWTVTAAWLF